MLLTLKGKLKSIDLFADTIDKDFGAPVDLVNIEEGAGTCRLSKLITH